LAALLALHICTSGVINKALTLDASAYRINKVLQQYFVYSGKKFGCAV
jgi:hypothetical protein